MMASRYRLAIRLIRTLARSIPRGEDGEVTLVQAALLQPADDARRLRAHPDVAAVHGYVGGLGR